MISTSEFLSEAGLGEKFTEEELQFHLVGVLTSWGHSCQTEVWVGEGAKGRADIVSSWGGGVVIEVKKFLDRDRLYQAYGQATAYSNFLQGKRLCLIGFLPPNPKDWESAVKTAEFLEQAGAVVVFLNYHPEFATVGQSWRIPWLESLLPKLPKLPNGNVIAIALALTLVLIFGLSANKQNIINEYPVLRSVWK